MIKPSRLVLGLIGIFFLAVFVFVVFYFVSPNSIDNRNSEQQKEMMENILEWGRLAPLSDSAAKVSVETEGNSFTRSFHASFIASKQEIDAWVVDSPGLYETMPQ